ncbi:MAG: hydroxymethylglutaryl-CoA reductase, degradative, partial [Rhodobacterales bacterium]|nr:hydroxymethylglutaryl-CoA reductase, degradative [Rhodobacterales bacterium]
MTSRIPGFYRLAPADRLMAIQERRCLPAEHIGALAGEGLTVEAADIMVENVISTFALPNAVAVNFTINGKDRLIPMVVEEPSVVAAVSNMAKLCRVSGGFRTETDPGVMIGQIQLGNVSHPAKTAQALRDAFPSLRELAQSVHPRLEARGGGLRGFEVRTPTYDEPGHPVEYMVVLHVLLDCVDAMGANMINTLCEALAPKVSELTGYPVGLRILSNLADRRLARAFVRLHPDQVATKTIPGPEVAKRIAASWRFAWADPYRAATHNKGVMNGVDAVCLATGNDWRAVEAGAHAFCSRDGQYRPMTRWEIDDEGYLLGSIEIPL